jgi:predicted Zn-dependent peptidase
VPGLRQRDERETAAIDLAFTILGGSRASRLWQSIRERQRLVSSISLTDITLQGDSLFVAFATLEPRNLEPAIEAIYKEIEAFAEKGPTRRELDRARKTLANHFLFQNETNAGQASTAGYFYTLTGDSTFAERYLEALREVSGDEVEQAAREYFDRARSNVFVVLPNSLAEFGDAQPPSESRTP